MSSAVATPLRAKKSAKGSTTAWLIQPSGSRRVRAAASAEAAGSP
jgi:hypothetical protein